MIFHSSNICGKSTNTLRYVIVHYHIFKNAGTSVDHILDTCFPNAFMHVDGPVPEFFINQTELNVMVRNRDQVKAISSHHVRLPVPNDQSITYLPVTFIRRPEIRIRSVWRFQRSRDDQHPETLLAKSHPFKDWIQYYLKSRNGAFLTNPQALLYAFRYDERTRVNNPEIRERAFENVERVPFVGIVERFVDSLKIFEALYQENIPNFKVNDIPWLNATSDNLDPQKEMEEIEDILGRGLLENLREHNRIDIELYETCIRKFDKLKADDKGSP